MKKLLLILFTFSVIGVTGQDPFNGDEMFSTVKKFVSLGEHRTGTKTDFTTSEWLGDELAKSGFKVNYFEFKLKQYFPERTSVITAASEVEAFPLWYLNDQIDLNVKGLLTTSLEDVKGKIVLVDLKPKTSNANTIISTLQTLIGKSAKGIIGYVDNAAGEIAAINAPLEGKPWDVPIVLVSSRDALALKNKHDGKNVSFNFKGTFKETVARNVYGTIGTGDQYIVVSTPISGWFICGGERGPGIATWLALAKWAATQKGYQFLFTANSGHELGFWGAHKFLEDGAPPVDKTKLWVHLGAGIATLDFEETAEGLKKKNTVDPKRSFFYSTSVKPGFDAAFAAVKGFKFDTKERAGGELLYVIQKGYPHVAGAAYSHPYFHMKSDDESKTSPEILQEVGLAFRDFISSQLQNGAN